MSSKLLLLSSLIALPIASAPAYANEKIGAGILQGIACALDPDSCRSTQSRNNSEVSPDVYTDPIREAKEKVSFKNGIMYVENPGPERIKQCDDAGYACKRTESGNLMLDTTIVKKTNLSTYPITNFYSWVIDKDSVRFVGGDKVKFTSYVRSKSTPDNYATVFDFEINSSFRQMGIQSTKVKYEILIKDESFDVAEGYPVTATLRCNSPIILPNGRKIKDICRDLQG